MYEPPQAIVLQDCVYVLHVANLIAAAPAGWVEDTFLHAPPYYYPFGSYPKTPDCVLIRQRDTVYVPVLCAEYDMIKTFVSSERSYCLYMKLL